MYETAAYLEEDVVRLQVPVTDPMVVQIHDLKQRAVSTHLPSRDFALFYLPAFVMLATYRAAVTSSTGPSLPILSKSDPPEQNSITR